MLAIALQPALGLLGAVLPGTTHSPILIHQPEQISADAPEQRSLFHALTLARAVQDRNRTPHHLDQSGGSQPGWVRPEGVPTHHEHRAMTTTQHSNQLLEELVAEEIGYQIDQIAEDLQREGWPIAMVKRFMHVAVERLPE